MSGDQTEYRVRGMTCGGCERSMRGALARVAPGVEAEISHADDAVRVRGAHDPEDVRRAAEAAGFAFEGAVG